MKKTEKSRDGRAASQRQLRVGEELRHLLAEILGRDELRDPALQGTTITVTEVRISPDLKSATVFVMPLGGKDAPDRIAALQRAAGFLRSLIAREVTLRSVPSLRFALDTSFDHASHIEELLHRPEVERDILSARAEGPPAGGEDDGA
ncbi:MAG: rbfA [Rhodospirillales bacterium]|jgi:ribosome-binding factor A|nr:rbfA [Rhodospirillales bacterium]